MRDTLSGLAERSKDGKTPLPLMVAVIVKPQESAIRYHEWVEFTPFEESFTYLFQKKCTWVSRSVNAKRATNELIANKLLVWFESWWVENLYRNKIRWDNVNGFCCTFCVDASWNCPFMTYCRKSSEPYLRLVWQSMELLWNLNILALSFLWERLWNIIQNIRYTFYKDSGDLHFLFWSTVF